MNWFNFVCMNWTIITETTQEPQSEVFAIGHQNEMLVGWCAKDTAGDWYCESDGEILEDVRAFILCSDIEKDFVSKHPDSAWK